MIVVPVGVAVGSHGAGATAGTGSAIAVVPVDPASGECTTLADGIGLAAGEPKPATA
ncbi:MAG: hypothetical protein LBD77_07315 [Bifidobacteriaceae bacterium]|jgi:hypothetical protein|nr:hypothetical protein [Bifidobacteriaceae bacterium]